jgi:glycine betaine catabolism A
VHKDAVEGVDYDLQKLIEVWRATNRQDADLVGMTHAGVSGIGYEPGPYSRFTEYQLENFSTWYIERLTAFGYADEASHGL